jgi:ketosteroid isomerase-like protein
MHVNANTPQDAEDAYYDALEAGSLADLMAIWDDAEDIACLLPMQPLAHGREAVHSAFAPFFDQGRKVAISVTHLQWFETETFAVHLVEERAEPPPGQRTMPVYAINVYRHGPNGWRLIIHQNAPAPPPAGMPPPG